MSGSAAGKFQDHYVILGIDPGAGSEAIQNAYEQLAEKYGPDNLETPEPEKLAMVELAFEVLSDPQLRKEFDKLKGLDQDHGAPKFSGQAFFAGRGRETGLRMAILAILYDRRRGHPYRPSLSNRHLDGMLEATNEELTFALWYLKQRGFVTSDDKSNLVVSIEGMEYLEEHWPAAEVVLPFLKPSALPDPQPSEAGPEPAPEGEIAQPAIAALTRKGARIVGMLRGTVSNQS